MKQAKQRKIKPEVPETSPFELSESDLELAPSRTAAAEGQRLPTTAATST